MTFTHDAVRMFGALRGRNGTANCMVSATPVTLMGTRLSRDCRYVIEWVSMPLPTGDYRLTMEGKTIDMHHSKEGWRTVLN
jgi:hypothetical protein